MTVCDRQRMVLLAMMATMGAGLLLLWRFDPATSGLFPPCPFRVLTGWYCPGCGSLRAMHQLLQGNIRNAFKLNALAVVALPFLAYGMISRALLVLRWYELPRWFVPSSCIRALAAGIVVYGVVRNLPVYPFSILAPAALGLR